MLILQHPTEVFNAKGTARLLHLSLLGSCLVTGEVFAQTQWEQLLAALDVVRKGYLEAADQLYKSIDEHARTDGAYGIDPRDFRMKNSEAMQQILAVRDAAIAEAIDAADGHRAADLLIAQGALDLLS